MVTLLLSASCLIDPVASSCVLFVHFGKIHVGMERFVCQLVQQFCNENNESKSQGSPITSISTNIALFDKHAISRLKGSESSIIKNITIYHGRGLEKEVDELISYVVKCVYLKHMTLYSEK